MYCVYRNQAAAPYLSLCSYFFLSSFETLKFLVTLFSGTVRPRGLKLGTRMDSGQMYWVYRNQAAAAYLSLYFSFFSLSSFQTLKIFVTLFSGTVRPRRLKLGMGGMYCVYRNHAAALIHSLFFSVFFLSNFIALKIVRVFSELWGLEGWNFIQTWTVGSCIVYTEIRMLLHIHPFSSSFFFLSNFQILNIFVALFSGTVRPRMLKFVTHVNHGLMYRLYQNQTAASYSFLYFFIFLPLQFSNIKNFVALLSGIAKQYKHEE